MLDQSPISNLYSRASYLILVPYQVNGIPQEPFAIFAGNGANLVRARLWHSPTWTNYSTLADVQKTFTRAQAAGMHTLLTIHYSDE